MKERCIGGRNGKKGKQEEGKERKIYRRKGRKERYIGGREGKKGIQEEGKEKKIYREQENRGIK